MISPETCDHALGERFRLVRALASGPSVWAAVETQPDGRTQLVVTETVRRGGALSDEDIGDWVRDARRLAVLDHPNVARVRDVVIRSDLVLVASEFVEGVRYAKVAIGSRRAPLEVGLRVLVDALAGLSAIHNLRDAKRQPLDLFHGEMTPEAIVVGSDGVSRIVRACRPRQARAKPEPPQSDYLAPEVLLGDASADSRADVYSIGVMLWEALSGARLFEHLLPSQIVRALLGGRIARAAAPHDAVWAEPLADAAARALSVDPQQRFESAAAMAAELRRIAGPKLAQATRVATFVREYSPPSIEELNPEDVRSTSAPPVVSGPTAAIDLGESEKKAGGGEASTIAPVIDETARVSNSRARSPGVRFAVAAPAVVAVALGGWWVAARSGQGQAQMSEPIATPMVVRSATAAAPSSAPRAAAASASAPAAAAAAAAACASAPPGPAPRPKRP